MVYEKFLRSGVGLVGKGIEAEAVSVGRGSAARRAEEVVFVGRGSVARRAEEELDVASVAPGQVAWSCACTAGATEGGTEGALAVSGLAGSDVSVGSCLMSDDVVELVEF